ncbi:amidoligase family protein, partial [uncultured Oscillibacter sp.]|uniref:amidoligase family protein n=1 Tax=uncultured Oscillibacter sp. TaxID=876091 RepID=UPI0026029083
MVGLKEQCFGVEIEMTGITREQAARALAEYFGTEAVYHGGAYDSWIVKDPRRKTWKLMSDS